MTVACIICGTLSKEKNRPLKFLCLREYRGQEGSFWYFCSWKCLKQFTDMKVGEIKLQDIGETNE